MWPFGKKMTLEESGFFRGFIDWHSHILPGVDDGVQTMDESLQILAKYEHLGIAEVWLTPHIMEDMPNKTEYLQKCFSELKRNYNGNIKLHLASENMMDTLFVNRLKEDDLLPLGSGQRYLLVETSYFEPPMNLYDILSNIKKKGYIPVLAHPERYGYMEKPYYRQLKNMGVEFQLNLLSLGGIYGQRVQKKAEWLLKEDLYKISGTDIHNYKICRDFLVNTNLTTRNFYLLQTLGTQSI